MQLLDVWARIL